MECPKPFVEQFIGRPDDEIKRDLKNWMRQKRLIDATRLLINLWIANRPLFDGGETAPEKFEKLKELEEWIAAGTFCFAPIASEGRFDLSAVQLQERLQDRHHWIAVLLKGNDQEVWQALQNSHDKRPPIVFPEDDPHLVQAKEIAPSLRRISDRYFRKLADDFADIVIVQAVRLIRDELECINISEHERRIVQLEHTARDRFPHLQPEVTNFGAHYRKSRTEIHSSIDVTLGSARYGWALLVMITIWIGITKAIPEQNPDYYDVVYKLTAGLNIGLGYLLARIYRESSHLRSWRERQIAHFEKQMNLTQP